MSDRSLSHRTNAPHGELAGLAAKLDKTSHRWVTSHGVAKNCDFKVLRRGRWFVFDGRVDSQFTKNRLFFLTPKVDGARWVIDRLRVQRPTTPRPSQRDV